MDIVFTREVADGLRERYTVLELETFEVSEDKKIEAFCIVPAEKIINEMGQLEDNIRMHEQLVQSLKEGNNEIVLGLADLLIGKFGGELDSFYEIIRDRVKPSI